MAIKIFIDQGHNPRTVNTGAEGNGIFEQNVTYEVGNYLYELLRQNPNFEVRRSRTSPDQVLGTSNASSLRTRVEMANSWGADYFVSIHTNASLNPAANGTEVYVYRTGSAAYYLGIDVLNAIVNRMGTSNRGIKANPSLYVLRRTKMPAILVELAFISNYSDAMKLENDPYGFAYAIYRGILRYFGLIV
ncbi:MAG: N-acetylmuramoyl-L-alanine amidase [Clostridia bacterium]|nr:N-acetylmuramoyl-L-alanine amidase [Clostridia bacterium]